MKLPVPDCSFDAAYEIEATCHAPDLRGCYACAPAPRTAWLAASWLLLLRGASARSIACWLPPAVLVL